MAHLNYSQRQQIETGIRAGKSNTRIAQEIGVHPSTVGRELARNREAREAYNAYMAHLMAASRQVLATEKRFDSVSYKVQPYRFKLFFSTYHEFRLPGLYYSRMPFMGVNYFNNHSYWEYFYLKERYLGTYRFDQISGFNRPSGRTNWPVFLPMDFRIRTGLEPASFETLKSSFHNFRCNLSSTPRPRSIINRPGKPVKCRIRILKSTLSLTTDLLKKPNTSVHRQSPSIGILLTANVRTQSDKLPVKMIFRRGTYSLLSNYSKNLPELF